MLFSCDFNVRISKKTSVMMILIFLALNVALFMPARRTVQISSVKILTHIFVLRSIDITYSYVIVLFTIQDDDCCFLFGTTIVLSTVHKLTCVVYDSKFL